MGTTIDRNIASSKKARKSTPKVRSGCITCKARRVKCDEQKPECQRCLRANRKCEGYPVGARGQATQQLPLEPTSITAYSIPFKVPGSQADRQLLHYFCSQAAWNLSSCTDPTLWTELILQRANHQPVIRNALVALSSLHKDYLCGELAGAGTDQYETPTPYSAANVKAMAMISRCHRQLRYYLSRPDASPDVALVCSVIFYTFESLLGESQRAIWHLDQGLILLRKCQLDTSFVSNDDSLIPHLSTLLHHLDLQASCFDDRRPPLLTLATDAEIKGHVDIVPDTFLDLTHAEAVLTKIQNWVLHHLVNYVHYRGAAVEELPSESFVERLVLAAQLQKYEAVLDTFAYHRSPILNTECHGEDHRQQRTQRILLLRVNLHTFIYLVKENLPLVTADTYDMAKKVMALLPGYSGRPLPQIVLSSGNTEADLESALASIEALLSQTWPPDSAAPSTESPTRTYTLSTHLIAAIYFLSLKTTNKQILEKATALFSHPRLRHARDGLWDARTAAFLVSNLAGVRQNGNVTEGRNASDILMHIAEQDVGVDIAQLQRIFSLSEKSGLPMMQSKKFTLVLRQGAMVRRHIGQEYSVDTSTSISATAGRDAYDHHSEHQHIADANYTLSTDHLAPMPVPPRRTPGKTGPSRAPGTCGRERQSEDTTDVYPQYITTGIKSGTCLSTLSGVSKPKPTPVITRPLHF
ncbi:hypothetical protein A1O7_04008 [Cladophialophora yegresii CBS 114405]|uniref:Zn(2)-C6 fungal-type domain-containing protein n=1 Tax=Cladophialophora yegresii CBS 114405 TaxID=1182544 RepID=W9W5S2_9EURO|nr:uncharacterized protein A1O7_04008 [Cladophialophora yegresii CBS 114405]EXJ59861.1 hypothetical protein A1O7_04008 [Cladophialophora yegresii CBS 114405]